VSADLLPPGGVLLHIGPYKTGSTSIQYALFDHQDDLRQRGVIFPGDTHRQRRPGWGVLGWTPRGRKRATLDEWYALVDSVRDVGEHRVCLTTEDFGWASAAQASRIVADLGAARVHVLAVVRRLDRLLPSEWQERVKTFHETKPYDDWLRAVLGDDRTEPSAHEFWASHDVGAQLSNWTSALPPAQMTVLVTDDRDRGALAGIFERMLGLPDGYLHTSVEANPSLTAERIELLRRLNVASASNGWSDRLHLFAVEVGVKSALMAAPPSPFDHQLPPLPAWALERVAVLSEEQITAIRESGVDVVGDLACLRIPTEPTSVPAAEPPGAVSVEASAMALEGALDGAVRLLTQTQRKHKRELTALRQQLADARRQLAARTDDSAAAPYAGS